jgi:LAO/AO transport system kinase
MESLAQRPEAFIRPSPSGNTPGGVARRSFETLLLCEAAGYDVIIVETVGVGQAETRVSQMTDLFLLLLLPGGGDELQGIKRGIMELADIIVVNKADGPQAELAEETARDYRNALKLLHPNYNNWSVPIQTCSALEKRGVKEIWSTIDAFLKQMSASGQIDHNRREQGLEWMWSEIADTLIVRLHDSKHMKDTIVDMENRVRNGRLPAPTAANKLVQTFLNFANEEPET